MMDQRELQQRVAAILEEEERIDVDWARVETLCFELDELLRNSGGIDVPDALYHFVDDADIRQKDGRYAEWQRSLLRRYVETGEMVEHAPSIPLPWWSCLVVLSIVVGGLTWWWL